MGRFHVVWIDAGARRRLTRLALAAPVLVLVAWWFCARMPGRMWRGPLPPLTPAQVALRDGLRRDLTRLAGDIGPRNLTSAPDGLARARDWLEGELRANGYTPLRQTYEVREPGVPAGRGDHAANVIAILAGTTRAGEIVVVGAHYDSVAVDSVCPAANDNGSGVAATLALARALARQPQPRTVRFVFFANEEPPYCQTENMGSLVYARACRAARDWVVAMLSLETIGYYTDAPGSQRYPAPGLDWIYPRTGNFLAFVGSVGHRRGVLDAIAAFRRHARFPSVGLVSSAWVPGIAWSDHWSFWAVGYPGLMITDTAPFRCPFYHNRSGEDTLDKIDFDRLARVTDGLTGAVRELAGG